LDLSESPPFQTDREFLLSLQFEYPISSINLQTLLTHNSEPSPCFCYVILFQSITAIFFSSSISSEILTLLTDGLTKIATTTFCEYASFLFETLLDKILNSPNFEFDLPCWASVVLHFQANQALPNTTYPLFCQLFTKAIQADDHQYIDSLLSVVCGVFEEGRDLIQGHPIDGWLSMLDPFISVFSIRVVQILTRISRVTKSQSTIMRIFQILSPSFVVFLVNSGKHLRISQNECEILRFDESVFSPKFSFAESAEFTDGLKPIESFFIGNVESSLSFLALEIREVVAETVKYFQIAMPDCVKIFLEDLCGAVIHVTEDSLVYYDLVGSFVALIEGLSFPFLFAIMLSFFNQDQIVFDEQH
jgi:hypothetical protein